MGVRTTLAAATVIAVYALLDWLTATGRWDKYREKTLERQKKLGVVPQDTKLTVRSEGLLAWDSLNADQKKIHARFHSLSRARSRKSRLC
jgi:hypothetical protein